MTGNNLNKRVEVADVLRGFAIMGILFIHFSEHFNLHYHPAEYDRGMIISNYIIKTILSGVFKEKAYAIFALLFGFSFWIQYDSLRQKGIDFRRRYMWRLLLLFIIGNFNAIFFTGDILVLYSIIGLILIPMAHLPTKYIIGIATFLLLQPWEWGKIIYVAIEGISASGGRASGGYFSQVFRVLTEDSFIDTAKMNIYTGQLASLTWCWEQGRFFLTAALFLFGMLTARARLLLNTPKNMDFWMYAGFISFSLFLFFNHTLDILPQWTDNGAIAASLRTIWHSWSGCCLMVTMVSVIILLYYQTKLHAALQCLSPCGRMSLTNYVSQSIAGSFLFYGWGLALYRTWGTTYSFLAGLVFFILQYFFSVWWLKHHRQGIIEKWWKKMTWIGFTKQDAPEKKA